MPSTAIAPQPTPSAPQSPGPAPLVKPQGDAEIPKIDSPSGPSAYDELDAIADDGKPPEKAPEKPAFRKPEAPKPKPEEASFEPEDDDEPAPSETPEPKKEPESAKPLKAPELRAAYDSLKKKHAELEKKVTELSSKPAEDPEKPVLIERLKERDAKLKELEELLSLSNYEETQEYKDNYYEPCIKAYTEGLDRVTRMTVTEPDGTDRPGTKADFDKIVSTSDDGEAAEKAYEMYGNRAPIAILAREKFLTAHALRQKAIKDNRENASTREKARIEESAKQRAEMEKTRAAHSAEFERLTSEAVDKYPSAFKAADGDDVGKAALEKGFAYVDSAFKPDGKIPPAEMVKIHAVIRNKAAGYDYLALRLKRERTARKKAEGELSAIRDSGNSGSLGARRPTGGNGTKSADQELDEIAAGNR